MLSFTPYSTIKDLHLFGLGGFSELGFPYSAPCGLLLVRRGALEELNSLAKILQRVTNDGPPAGDVGFKPLATSPYQQHNMQLQESTLVKRCPGLNTSGAQNRSWYVKGFSKKLQSSKSARTSRCKDPENLDEEVKPFITV